jgi:prophage tail gpP-like protein
MAGEIVSVVVGGVTYRGFEQVKVRGGVKEAARSFELKVAAEAGPSAVASIFQPFTPVQIFAAMEGGGSGSDDDDLGDLVFTGYVDRYRPKLSKSEAHITISGRAKGQDAVDSSVEHRKSDYVNQTSLAIAQDQDIFGIGFSIDAGLTLTPQDRWRPNPGQTLFHSLDALSHDDECTMAGQPDGSIKMTQAGVNPPRQPTPLIEGVNILVGEADFNVSGRHSSVNVHGQAAYGNGAQNTQISATATDQTVPRTRPIHIHHHHHTDQGRISRKATHHRDHEAGNAIKATITAQGWHDDSGMLWTPGNVVWTESPFLALAQDMLIEAVEYMQDDKEGSLTKLELVDPRAHGGQGGGVNQSGKSWNMDSSDAQPSLATPASAEPPQGSGLF